MKRLTILGSTGSIGTQTLEVVEEHPDQLKVIALAAGRNIERLRQQILKYEPELACLWKEEDARILQNELQKEGSKTKVLYGMDGLIACATLSGADIVVAAMVGMIGLRPVIAAINKGKDIALANKETLVTAGHIIMPLAREKKVKLLPVDSEHSAIFQCLQGNEGNKIAKILLTASGGPFRKKTREELAHVTVEDALCHPNWSMGSKITIDSASMMNKGLEVIEAKWLFGVDIDNVNVVVQPQSIIHSMVEFQDGAVIAQLGTPDMRLPIQYALLYPHRDILSGERLDFKSISQICFEEPPVHTLRGLSIACLAGKIGGSMTTVMNAANERAVALFLAKKISFLDIYDMIEKCMESHEVIANPTLDDILQIEAETYDSIDRR